MSTKEGEHQRASYLMHTSYIPTATVRYPTLGAVVARELADAASELPSFVRIGNRGPGVATDGGLLGSKYDSFAVQSATRPPENTRPATESDRYQARLALLDRLEAAAPTSASAAQVRDHSTLYETTSRMVLSPSMQAFDISREPESVRAAYGLTASANETSIRPNGGPRTAPRGEFAAGCLMARRLVEAGVTFVEVGLGGWDTHQDNFDAVKRLCESMDQPYAALIEDLRQRGMLDNTLVIWMGEFGRTPRINPRGGRDHYPRAFSAVLAGAGIQVGQVYGETDAGGYAVTDSPVSEKDLFQTVYKALKIDAHKENMSPIGRPIRIVEGGQAVTGLLA
jgi:hypothetical protein